MRDICRLQLRGLSLFCPRARHHALFLLLGIVVIDFDRLRHIAHQHLRHSWRDVAPILATHALCQASQSDHRGPPCTCQKTEQVCRCRVTGGDGVLQQHPLQLHLCTQRSEALSKHVHGSTDLRRSVSASFVSSWQISSARASPPITISCSWDQRSTPVSYLVARLLIELSKSLRRETSVSLAIRPVRAPLRHRRGSLHVIQSIRKKMFFETFHHDKSPPKTVFFQVQGSPAETSETSETSETNEKTAIWHRFSGQFCMVSFVSLVSIVRISQQNCSQTGEPATLVFVSLVSLVSIAQLLKSSKNRQVS